MSRKENELPVKTWIVREYRSVRHALSSSSPARTKQVSARTRKEAIKLYKETYGLAAGHRLTAFPERESGTEPEPPDKK